MPITIDKLLNAMATTSTRLVIDKANLTGTAGSYISMWRSTGQPAQGAIPSSAAVCDETTTGGFLLPQQTEPVKSYLTYLESASSNSAITIEVHDRLVHMGGLVGNLATSQSANLDLDTFLSNSNISGRIGDEDYSDVQWWLEWYTATGATATVATVNVTYADGTTGNLSNISLAATRPASHMVNLNMYRPAAISKYIRGVNSVQLSVTTGTAGNFGVTATRLRGSNFMPLANAKFSVGWADMPISEVPQNACLSICALTSTSSSGTIRGGGRVSHIDPS